MREATSRTRRLGRAVSQGILENGANMIVAKLVIDFLVVLIR